MTTILLKLAVPILVVDVAIYYPFFRVYDQEIYEKELAEAEEGSSEVSEDRVGESAVLAV